MPYLCAGSVGNVLCETAQIGVFGTTVELADGLQRGYDAGGQGEGDRYRRELFLPDVLPIMHRPESNADTELLQLRESFDSRTPNEEDRI